MYNETPTRGFPNNSALGKAIRVTMSAGYLIAADAAASELGVLEYKTLAADELGTVRMRTSQGTKPMVANAAITQYAKVYRAASGKVGPTGSSVCGIALEAATADGDIIEVLPMEADSVEAIGASTAAAGSTTADAGVLPAATARNYPTTAADDTKGVRIHASDKVTGRKLFIGNGVSNKILKVYAPSGGTINGAAADAAFSSASGKGVTIICLDATANTWLAA